MAVDLDARALSVCNHHSVFIHKIRIEVLKALKTIAAYVIPSTILYI